MTDGMTDHSETEGTTPLTDHALEKLRELAMGNGLEPSSIKVDSTSESVYTLEGTLTLSPLCETETARYAGRVRGSGRQMVANSQALQSEVRRVQSAFRDQPDWIEAVRLELSRTKGEGWGLDGGKVTLPKQSVILAATQGCNVCGGRKLIPCIRCEGRGYELCTQCKGARQEFCFNCAGTGQNPQQPGQPCVTCHGQRYIPCRLCHASGQSACQLCQTRGGTECQPCQATGQLTEEVHLNCGASTHFRFTGKDMPSGMRRGLDRLGIVNLSKGHAFIETVEPKEDGSDIDAGGPPHPHGQGGPDPHKDRPPDPTLHYRATLPFAEVKMSIGPKKAIIGVFGNRRILVDVPLFLDEALKPWRDKLDLVRRGQATIEEAIEARTIHDALALNLEGKGSIKELRRLYPVGLSTAVAGDILRDTHRAAKRFTQKIRGIASGIWALISVAVFAACYYSKLPKTVAAGPPSYTYALEFLPPLLMAGLGWAFISLMTHRHLRSNFAHLKVARLQRTGKIGAVFIGAIFVLWFAVLWLSPARPFWLSMKY